MPPDDGVISWLGSVSNWQHHCQFDITFRPCWRPNYDIIVIDERFGPSERAVRRHHPRAYEFSQVPFCRTFWYPLPRNRKYSFRLFRRRQLKSGAYLVTTQTPGQSALQFQRQLNISRYATAFQTLHCNHTFSGPLLWN